MGSKFQLLRGDSRFACNSCNVQKFSHSKYQRFQPSRFDQESPDLMCCLPPNFYQILPIYHEILKMRGKKLLIFFLRSECKTLYNYTFLSYNISPSLSIEHRVFVQTHKASSLTPFSKLQKWWTSMTETAVLRLKVIQVTEMQEMPLERN